MKLYLAGPMRGYKQSNFPEFNRVAALLRSYGYEVCNPAEHDLETMAKTGQSIAELDLRDCIKFDLNWIIDHAEGIALLDNAEYSKGARAECALADFLDLQSFHYSQWLNRAALAQLVG